MATAIVKTANGAVTLKDAYLHMDNMFGVDIRTGERTRISEHLITSIDWIAR